MFLSENAGKTYRMTRNGEQIKGKIHSPFWMEDDVEIGLDAMTPIEADCLIAAIIAIGYNIDSDPFSFFKQKEER
ncbi:MAG: hypothetical protein AAGA77_01720 [Bacteroidota bacterium]